MGLTGDVLGGCELDIKVPFRNAYAIRNVWAHNAGIADAKFVERSNGLGFAVGQPVDVKYDAKLNLCLSSMITYAMIAANRHRKANGVGPMPLKGKPRETPIGQAYLERYPEA